MKMEVVQAELNKWGEAIVTTSSGQTFELHTGDTKFDFDNRVIRFTAPGAHFVIDGDAIEYIKMHYSHSED